MAAAISSLSQQGPAEQHRRLVWGSWEAQPSPLQPLALDVKQVLSHFAHRNMRKSLQHNQGYTLLHVGGSSTHSLTHSLSVNIL